MFAEISSSARLQEIVFNCAAAKSFTVFSTAAELSRKTLYDVICVSLFLKLPRTERVTVLAINQWPNIKLKRSLLSIIMAVQITNANVFKAYKAHLHIDGTIFFFFFFSQDINTLSLLCTSASFSLSLPLIMHLIVKQLSFSW